MRLLLTIQRLATGLVLAIGLLAGCQRSSYSFQGPPAATIQAGAAVSAGPVAAKGNLQAIGTVAVRPLVAVAVRAQRAGQRRAHPAPRPAVAHAVTKKHHPQVLAPHQLLNTAPPPAAPDEPKPYHKGVAFALAVVLGLLGAHQFYLGRNSDGWYYLLFTLVCVTLCFIAIPLANSAFIGSGVGGFAVALFLLVAGFAGLGYAYLHALVDGVRILQGKLQRREKQST